MSTVYDFEARQINGKDIALSAFKGQVMLIVNTASQCGFTPQFGGLEELHKSYAGKGLAVLGFPCNQFGSQDPGNDDEISAFCQVNYGVSFPMMSKIDVNGPAAHPLYKWLSSVAPGLLGSKAIKSWPRAKIPSPVSTSRSCSGCALDRAPICTSSGLPAPMRGRQPMAVSARFATALTHDES